MVMVKIREQLSPLTGSTRKLVVCTMLWLSLAMAGCDASSTAPSVSGGTGARTEKLKTNLSPEEMREVAKPLSETPGLSVETNAGQNVGQGFNDQLNPAKGLNTKRLFDTRVESDDERFERLEAAVQAMRDDIDRTAPSINRLIAIESEIQTLVDQLQSLVGDNGASVADVPIPPVSAQLLEDTPTTPTTMPPLPPDAQAMQNVLQQTTQASAPPAPTLAIPPPAVEPPPAPVPAPAAAPASTPSAGGLTLTGLRIGDHDKTTRIVFETTGKPTYSADVDPEKILLVNFTSGSSNLSAAQLKSKSDLIKSIDVTPQGNGGFIVAMTLSKMTNIVRQGVLPPDGENPNYRVYIDINR